MTEKFNTLRLGKRFASPNKVSLLFSVEPNILNAFGFENKPHNIIEGIDGKEVIAAKDRTKNKSSCRTLPLVPQYRQLLLEMKAHQDACKELCGNSYHNSDYIYANDMDQPIKPNYVTQHFPLILKKNNLRKITVHELRHSCASLLLKSGVSMKDIQAWLSHSSYNTTANIYAHRDLSAKGNTGATMSERMDISRTLTAMEC